MSELERRADKYRVWCPCDFSERFASEYAAKAVLADHADDCVNTPELEELT